MIEAQLPSGGVPAPQSAPFLALEGVSKTFSARKGTAHPALQHVHLHVDSGDFLCILGRSGCGKSTLLNLVAGLDFPDAGPESGQVRLHGQPVTGPDRNRMMMFQDAALFPWLDVLDNVLYGLKLVPGLQPPEQRDRALHFLEMVGLSHVTHFRIHQLSGGMRQRVALARALAPDPEILLMDEPFSALDAMTREQLYDDVQSIWLQRRTTVLMVTHNVREAACLGTHVAIMDAGRLLARSPIPLPYPRSMNDPELAESAARITRILQSHG